MADPRHSKGVSDVLQNFIREQENAPLNAGNLLTLRHPSVEGGLDTIGFGHLLTQAEVDKGEVYGRSLATLTLDDAEAILAEDIRRKQNNVAKRYKKMTGDSFSDLSQRKQDMLTDYEYNLRGGISAFPSFVNAVKSGDRKKQEEEYSRNFTDAKGVRRPLARNGAFYDTFMSDEAIQILGE